MKGCIGIWLVIILWACNKSPQPADIPAQGVEYQKLQTGPGGRQMWLAMPVQANVSKKYPLIFLLDAHGRAYQLIRQLGPQLVRQGYLLAVSSSFHNGVSQPHALIKESLQLLQHHSPLAIDDKRITLAGFSGGARAAGQYALQDTSLQFVWLMGAGIELSPQQHAAAQNKHWMLFAGKTGFNYQEVREFSFYLSSIQADYSLFQTTQGHTYPDSQTISHVLTWLSFREMKQGLRQDNPRKRDTFLKQQQLLITRARNAERDWEEWKLLRTTLNYLKGHPIPKELPRRYQQLFEADAIDRHNQELELSIKNENQLKRQFLVNMRQKNAAWWENQIHYLKQQARSKTGEERYSLKRVLAFIQIVSHLYFEEAWQQGSIVRQQHYLRIYGLVDSLQPDYLYLKAKYHARQGARDSANRYLQQALDKGFDKPYLITQDAWLSELPVARQGHRLHH